MAIDWFRQVCALHLMWREPIKSAIERSARAHLHRNHRSLNNKKQVAVAHFSIHFKSIQQNVCVRSHDHVRGRCETTWCRRSLRPFVEPNKRIEKRRKSRTKNSCTIFHIISIQTWASHHFYFLQWRLVYRERVGARALARASITCCLGGSL